jgi:hypothetical protein
MKKTKIIYRVFTGLFAFAMFSSAIPDVLSIPVAVEGFQQMGMPVYLLPFLGIAKIFGVIAILIPGYARIKEWAPGLVFDLVGATYCIIASGQPAGGALFMILPLALAAGSYSWYHKRLKAGAAKNYAPANRLGRELAAA